MSLTTPFINGTFEKDGSIGKGIVEGAIDTIASIGPVDGVIVGAATLGPFGAIAYNGIGVVVVGTAGFLGGPVLGVFFGGMYEAAYDDNKMSLQDKIDSLGHWIDKTGKALAEGNRHLGQALQLKYGGLK